MDMSRRCFDDDGDGVGHAVSVHFNADAFAIAEVGDCFAEMLQMLRKGRHTFSFAFARGLAQDASWLHVGVRFNEGAVMYELICASSCHFANQKQCK